MKVTILPSRSNSFTDCPVSLTVYSPLPSIVAHLKRKVKNYFRQHLFWTPYSCFYTMILMLFNKRNSYVRCCKKKVLDKTTNMCYPKTLKAFKGFCFSFFVFNVLFLFKVLNACVHLCEMYPTSVKASRTSLNHARRL